MVNLVNSFSSALSNFCFSSFLLALFQRNPQALHNLWEFLIGQEKAFLLGNEGGVYVRARPGWTITPVGGGGSLTLLALLLLLYFFTIGRAAF